MYSPSLLKTFFAVLVINYYVIGYASAQSLREAAPRSQLSGWPCYGNAANSYEADYVARVGSPLNFPVYGRCAGDNKQNSTATITGTLPPGLKLRGFNIVGVAQIPGDFNFSVRYTKSDGSYLASFHIKINDKSGTE